MNKETKGMLIGFIGILIFSLTLPVSKIAILSFDPYFIAFGRACLAGLAALIYLYFNPNDFKTLFIIAFIPGLLAIFLTFRAKEKNINSLFVKTASIPFNPLQ